jgi:formate hydrogenlyase transcriptional activator
MVSGLLRRNLVPTPIEGAVGDEQLMSSESDGSAAGIDAGAEKALLTAILALSRRLDVPQTCRAMLDAAEGIFAARCAWILLHERSTGELVTADIRGAGAEMYRNARIPRDRGIVGLAFSRREAVFVAQPLDDDRWFEPERVRNAVVGSILMVPLVIEDDVLGVVGLTSTRFTADAPPTDDDLARFRGLAAIAAAGIRNAQLVTALEEDRLRLRRLLDERRQLKSEVGHLRDQVREWHSLNTIVGESAGFKHVLGQVELVAPADSTVLLLGETGTGKELFARAIHEQSRRCGKPFVAVNCAALPESLVESELFGYEKGAFTGAFGRKAGKFELADSGTLFLDEIGDLPAQAQAKLLRILQEREVQRVGSTRGIPINVRLISATNQDLSLAMQSGRFRQDLFYRLSVFPIRVPPLRERTDDIPLLVAHFLRRFAEQQHTSLPQLGEGVREQLMTYDWPGNVRELQNVIERAVIISRGSVIGTDLIMLKAAAGVDHPVAPAEPPAFRPVEARQRGNMIRFADAERRAIGSALELAGWRISGRGGAADILGLKPTTLHAKMKRLGIHRPGIEVSG